MNYRLFTIVFQSVKAKEKNDDVVNKIVSTVLDKCGCDFTSDQLTESVFLCSSSSPNSITYQVQLHGTLQANVSQILKIIQEELLNRRMSVKVQFSLLYIGKVCVVPYGTESPCEDVSSISTGTDIMNSIDSSTNIGFVTGITIIVGVIVLVGTLSVLLILKIALTKRKINTQ